MSKIEEHKRKYPKNYACCNDTITGCSLLCCKKKRNEFLENNILGQEETDDFIWEKTVDKTVKSINGSWSWASAGLLATACQATIALTRTEDGLSPTAQNWIYFIIVFIVGVLVAVAEHSFESPERIAKELEIKVPKKKAALGDPDAIEKETEIIKKASTIQIHPNDPKDVAKRILNFVQIEGNILLENLENLFIAIMSNVNALALNDAANATFADILADTKAAGTALVTAQWVFVLFMLWLTCFAGIQLGKIVDKIDIKMYDDLEKKGIENCKSDLLKHSTYKRIFKLLETSLGLVLAWALRDAFKMTILSLYGGSGTDNTIAALWTFTIVSTLIVTYTNTMNNRYYWLVPKDEFVGLQFDTENRKLIGKVLYSNLQAVVGIAWYDALLESPESLSEEDLEKHRVWILWVLSLGTMILSSVAGAYWERAKLRFKARSVGPVEAFFEAFDNWFDPKHVLDEGKKVSTIEDENRKGILVSNDKEDDNGKQKRRMKRESFEMEYLGGLLTLIIFALGFASGWLISAAVKATLTKTYDTVYDPDTVLPDEGVSGDVVWTMWLAFAIALVVSTLIMTFLSRTVTSIREKKKEIFKKWKAELEEQDKEIDQELGIMNDNDKKDGRAISNVTDDNEENNDKTEIEMEEQ